MLLEEPDDIDDGKIKLRREIDLLGATLIIIGCQIGSGIFVSPKGNFFHEKL